jgi:CheY-like chemotaxis protein
MQRSWIDRRALRPNGPRVDVRGMQPRVLLIGENASLNLSTRLESYGCRCWFASSYFEATALCRVQDFDLVLSPLRLRDGSAFPLVNRLRGSGSYIFY